MENQLIEWSASIIAAQGETISGDMYLIQDFPGGVLVAAVDGLGHGPEAAAAAQVAISVLEAHPEQSLDVLIRSCHEALKRMRGVVMSLACFRKGTMTWLGIGNVEGRLFHINRDNTYDTLLLRGGIVGLNLPSLTINTLPLTAGDTLIFVSDGIRNDFAHNLDAKAPPQQLVTHILNRSTKHSDDSLVVVARYL